MTLTDNTCSPLRHKFGKEKEEETKKKTGGERRSSALLLLLLLELLHWIPQLHEKEKHQIPLICLSTFSPSLPLPPSHTHTYHRTHTQTHTYWWSYRRRDRWNVGCVATCWQFFGSADQKKPDFQQQNCSRATPADSAAADVRVRPTIMQSHIIRSLKREAACKELIQNILDLVITLEWQNVTNRFDYIIII